jgi:hypothetical protein
MDNTHHMKADILLKLKTILNNQASTLYSNLNPPTSSSHDAKQGNSLVYDRPLGITRCGPSSPAANALDNNSIEKRDYGCNAIFDDEPGICNFHGGTPYSDSFASIQTTLTY